MDKLKIPDSVNKRFQGKSGQKKEQHLHSRNHVLADELSSKLGEPKRFGFYLKMAEKYNHDFLRRIASEVLEKNAKNPGALFAFLVKKERIEQEKNDTSNKKISG